MKVHNFAIFSPYFMKISVTVAKEANDSVFRPDFIFSVRFKFLKRIVFRFKGTVSREKLFT